MRAVARAWRVFDIFAAQGDQREGAVRYGLEEQGADVGLVLAEKERGCEADEEVEEGERLQGDRPKPVLQVQDVIDDQQDHENQVGSQADEREPDAARHGHGAEVLGVDFSFRPIVQGVYDYILRCHFQVLL